MFFRVANIRISYSFLVLIEISETIWNYICSNQQQPIKQYPIFIGFLFMLSGHFCHWKLKNTWFSGKGPMIPHGLHQHFHPILVLLPLSRQFHRYPQVLLRNALSTEIPGSSWIHPTRGGSVAWLGCSFGWNCFSVSNRFLGVLSWGPMPPNCDGFRVSIQNVIVLQFYSFTYKYFGYDFKLKLKGFQTSVETTNWEDVLERTLHLCLVCDASSHDLTSSFAISLFMKIDCLSQSLVKLLLEFGGSNQCNLDPPVPPTWYCCNLSWSIWEGFFHLGQV